MSEQLSNTLAELAQKLGVTVEILWDALFKQAKLMPTMLIIYISIYVVSLTSFIFGWRWANKKYDIWDDHLGFGIGIILFIIIFLLFGFGILMDAYWAFIAYYNPEYWILHKLKIV